MIVAYRLGHDLLPNPHKSSVDPYPRRPGKQPHGPLCEELCRSDGFSARQRSMRELRSKTCGFGVQVRGRFHTVRSGENTWKKMKGSKEVRRESRKGAGEGEVDAGGPLQNIGWGRNRQFETPICSVRMGHEIRRRAGRERYSKDDPAGICVGAYALGFHEKRLPPGRDTLVESSSAGSIPEMKKACRGGMSPGSKP